jgi:two-component system response regulator HydG
VSIERAHLAGGEVMRVGASAIRVELLAASPRDRQEAPSTFGRLVGNSPRMRAVYALGERLSKSDVPVVVEGETGTGKELFAECLHEAGARALAPFVVFDATTTSPDDVMDVLFGVQDGARGVFELAHGGTLFFDEIGDLAPEAQGALLRAVERGEIRRRGDSQWAKVNVRFIAATRRDLDRLVEQGRFREDLFYRLVVGRVELPPLRRREGDVPLLAAHFHRAIAGSGELPPAFLERYVGYDWPGNVRELANAVASAVALGPSAPLALLRGGAPASRRVTAASAASAPPPDPLRDILAADLPFPEARRRALDAFDRAYVERVLLQHDGNVGQAAAASGIARRYFQLVRARLR